ncbi:uncharacterized protein ATNIH1004_010598 [Aspergillus tanneri]|uniref:Uncharacterized protein n=1 Tax=Aspergillus tanneri TaxID=1220188 RepID=A0A5M9MFS2_9EURO|nr:uncharacterized protein ATNIH1004_010598 [Aspergillus tanneri]KAA8643823.1 hypothetical protein ATNIH1004_010598 [Aspergillus tanneri]
MKISLLTTLTLIGAALSVPVADGTKTIATGQPCTKDGKMGICEKGAREEQAPGYLQACELGDHNWLAEDE